MSTYDAADDLEFFNDCLNRLLQNLLLSDLGDSPLQEVSEEELRKCAWVASLLALSSDEYHQEKALSFGMVAYCLYREGPQSGMFEELLYIILSRIGNFPAMGAISEEEIEAYDEEKLSSYDSILGLELRQNSGSHRHENYYVTDFQKEALAALSEGNDLAISGPTSSGKSFILQRYIESQIEDSGFQGIYVVPTKALITEVSQELPELHPELSVRTGIYGDVDELPDNTFLVVTPERCLKLFDEGHQGFMDPDIAFFDEIQKLEDSSRGVLFEDIVTSLEKRWPSAQVVGAGPFLEDPGEVLEEITSREVAEVTTLLPPVFQLKVSFVFLPRRDQEWERRKVKCVIHSPTGDKPEVIIDEPENITFSDVKGSATRSIKEIVRTYSDDRKEIVYAFSKPKAQDWAISFAENSDKKESGFATPTEELIGFLESKIHEDYSLIDCIKSGVAFHHGRVPPIARQEIENIYRNTDDINMLVSTSTLLEGVNLPSQRIYVIHPKKGREDLTEFDFHNLIGRVGRLQKNLYGSIFCFEAKENDWSSEFLGSKTEKDITPITEKSLDEDFDKLRNALGKDDLYEVDDGVRYTTVLLRNRYIKGGEESVQKFLDEKGVNDDDSQEVVGELEKSCLNLDVPNDILRKNPTVDPARVDELISQVRRSPDDWVVQRQGLYESLGEVTRQLNHIFKFCNDPEADWWINPDDSEAKIDNLNHVITTASYWLQGMQYREMINRRFDHPKNDDDSIDETITDVMKLVNHDIRYMLEKHYMVLIDVLDKYQSPTNDWMQSFDQMLEMGSVKFPELRLLSEGVPRSVVVDLNIPEDVDDVYEYINLIEGYLDDFNRRHLEKQNII